MVVKSNFEWMYELIHKKWGLEHDGDGVTVHLKSGGVTRFYLNDLDDTSIESIEKEVEKTRKVWS